MCLYIQHTLQHALQHTICVIMSLIRRRVYVPLNTCICVELRLYLRAYVYYESKLDKGPDKEEEAKQ